MSSVKRLNGFFALVGRWEDFAFAEEFEHGVLADSTSLSGFNDGFELSAGDTFGAEIGIDVDKDLIIGD